MISSHVKDKRVVGGFLAILLFWLIEAAPLFTASGDLFLMDNLTLDVPMRVSAARRCLDGDWPIWGHDLLCGVSTVSEAQTGLFYPGFLLYLINPCADANDWYVGIHFLIIGMTFYAYSIHRQRSVTASILGSLILMNSQFLKIAHGNTGGLAVLSWMPLSFLLIDWMKDGSRRAFFAAAILNSAMMLTGVPNAAVVVFAIQGVYLLYRLGVYSIFRVIKSIFYLFILPLFMSAIQIVPLYFYFAESNRSSGSNWEIVAGRLSPASFPLKVAYIDPAATGYASPNPYSEWLWLGMFLALIILGVLRGGSRRDVWFWSIVGLIGYLAATTKIALSMVHMVPVLSWFQWPQMYLVWSVLAGTILATDGADWLGHWFSQISSRGAMSFTLFVALLGLIWTTDGLGKYLSSVDIYRSGEAASKQLLETNPRVRVWPYNHLYKFCEIDGKVTSESLAKAMSFFPGNMNLYYHIPHAFQNEIGDTVSPRRMVEIHKAAFDNQRHGMLNVAKIAGVTHFSGVTPLDIDGIECVSSGDTKLYRVKESPGEAWIVNEALKIVDPDERLNYLASSSFDPARTAIVESDLSIPAAVAGKVDVNAIVTPRTSGTSRIKEYECKSGGGGLLVLALRHSPFLRARVDGASVSLLPVNHAFCGVVVPQGTHTVSVEYLPLDLHIGFSASLIAWGFLISRWAAWKRESPSILSEASR